jgi:hypothetical protein
MRWRIGSALGLWGLALGAAAWAYSAGQNGRNPGLAFWLYVAALVLFGAGFVVFFWTWLWPRAKRTLERLAERSPVVLQSPVRWRVRPGRPLAERGWMDFLRDGRQAEREAVTIMGELTREIEKNVKRMNEHTRRIQEAGKRGPDLDRFYRLTSKSAKDIDKHAAKMERLEKRLRDATIRDGR